MGHCDDDGDDDDDDEEEEEEDEGDADAPAGDEKGNSSSNLRFSVAFALSF